MAAHIITYYEIKPGLRIEICKKSHVCHFQCEMISSNAGPHNMEIQVKHEMNLKQIMKVNS